MTQYTKEFREQAILLSDEIGVKKAAVAAGVKLPKNAGEKFPLLGI